MCVPVELTGDGIGESDGKGDQIGGFMIFVRDTFQRCVCIVGSRCGSSCCRLLVYVLGCGRILCLFLLGAVH